MLFALGNLVQGRLCDIDVPTFDQFRHLSKEKSQQKRSYVRAVNIGICHDDDTVVPQLVRVELILPDPTAEGRNDRTDLC